jgi:hypothetical protein
LRSKALMLTASTPAAPRLARILRHALLSEGMDAICWIRLWGWSEADFHGLKRTTHYARRGFGD